TECPRLQFRPFGSGSTLGQLDLRLFTFPKPILAIMSPRISAGTQVVVHRAVSGSNSAPVHPRGAVGLVVRTPAGTEVDYLIRFPDGFEASLPADQFEVLKHFKDRLPQSGAAEQFQLEDSVIYRCIVGSRAYGLETDVSDTDLRGVYLAPAEMQWSLFGTPEQFEDPQGQTCYWELQKFLVMALK